MPSDGSHKKEMLLQLGLPTSIYLHVEKLEQRAVWTADCRLWRVDAFLTVLSNKGQYKLNYIGIAMCPLC